MPKTYAEINEKISKGEVVVVTAEEMIDIVDEKGTEKAAQEVDVVTTGTFSPMCSSGAFLNFGHANPRMKVQKAWLNNINAYAGIAAVDLRVIWRIISSWIATVPVAALTAALIYVGLEVIFL